MPKTTRSNQFAAQLLAAALAGQRIEDGRQMSAKMQYSHIIVDFDGSNVATDVITLVKLPPGSIVFPALSKIVVTTDLATTTLTLDVGDVLDRTRYCAGANCSNVGPVDFLAPGIPVGFLTRFKVAEDALATLDTTLVTLRIASLVGPTAGRLAVVLAYATI